MANLSRVPAKIFAGDAVQDNIGQFGSAQLGTKNNTTDVATIQDLSAYTQGWQSAVISNRNYPTIEEMNGVMKVMSYQTAYLMQKGIAEYDSTTTYYTGDICKAVGSAVLYESLADNNTGNALSDNTKWKELQLGGSTRNIGEIVTSSIPLTDAGLHLLDGSVIQGGGAYDAFVEYIADLYTSGNYDDIFETEANWQTSETTYGVCGKFVYTVADGNDPATVRLPKVSGFIEGTLDINNLGDVMPAGLPDINGTVAANAQIVNRLSGAFTMASGYSATTGIAQATNSQGNLTFKASDSNSIYGNSNTVQPQAVQYYYYIVIANSTKTDIEIDIDQVATDLNYVSNPYRYDGQWVFSTTTLASGVSLNGSTDLEYDLSSYLPNDEYNYEVIATAYMKTGSTAGDGGYVQVHSDISSIYYICRLSAAAARAVDTAGSTIVPIGSGRKISVGRRADLRATFTFEIVGYRRIGTNV